MDIEEIEKEFVCFNYKNHQGVVSGRKVYPIRIYHGRTEYHPEPQWLLEGFDINKLAMRTYALRDAETHFLKNFSLWDMVHGDPAHLTYMLGLAKLNPHDIPRSDSEAAKSAITDVLEERNYPSNPMGAARAGWEALYRFITQKGK